MTRRLLVTGASGLLGQRVARLAQAAGWEVIGTYVRHPLALEGVSMRRMPLPHAAAPLIMDLRPDAVVHTAYTRVPAELWAVIVAGSAAVARACSSLGARLIHLSTDALFAGRPEPYRETDPPEPISPYGAAKAAAEELVQALCPQALLLRTSLLYNPPGVEPPDPFLTMALDLLRNPERGVLFTDEVRCPICVDDLAAAILELLPGQLQGLLHLAGPDPLNRHEFGRLLLQAAGYDPQGLPAGSAAVMRRPTRVVLDSHHAYRLLRSPIRSPYTVLGAVYDASS